MRNIRVDGYLDLDRVENLSLLSSSKGKWFSISGCQYYFKYSSEPYKELIGYYAANLLGLDAVYYDLAIYRGESGVISKSFYRDCCYYIDGKKLLGDYYIKSFNKDISFQSCFDFILCQSMNNLEMIWCALEDRYQDKMCVRTLMNEFVLMYIYSVIMGDVDKNPMNWCIEEGSIVKLVPLFDHGGILLSSYLNPSFTSEVSSYSESTYDSLEKFLRHSDSFFVYLFMDKFKALDMDAFQSIFNFIEKQIGCSISLDDKNMYLDIYSCHRDKIKDVIKKLERR